MDNKEAVEFLKASGYITMRKKMTCSCTLKEFLQLIESKVSTDPTTGTSDELKFVNDFLRVLDEEMVDVSQIVIF